MKIHSLDEICSEVQSHSLDQHMIYKVMITYAKDHVKYVKGKGPKPKTPYIFVHGSGGKN